MQDTLTTPWCFANRREVADLSLFAHRLYNPHIRRWLTNDPLGFEDGLNLYAYVHNNPFRYSDPDGQFAFAIPITVTLFEVAFSAAAVASAPVWLPAVGTTIATALVVYGCYELAVYTGNLLDDPIEGVEDKPVDVQGQGKRPPYCGEKLGDDPTVCPGEGFQWKGRGKPETGKGSWVKDLDLPTEESLHPDLWHNPPVGPHWDYEGPEGKARLNPNGTWVWK